MSHSAEMLSNLGIQHEAKVISAHRTPDLLDEYCAGLQEKGIKVIIAGAGLAAALPGVVAAKTTIPVVGVPLVVGSLDGLDALMSIVQMPPGIPVGTMALGKPGAINAALFAAAILALTDAGIADRISAYREKQAQKILESELD
jgi:5-(carboxyamino)imidazole ribonucleotide mutase